MNVRENWTGRIVTAVAAGAFVSLVLALYADLPSLFGALAAFRWSVIPFVLVLTLTNYFLRFLKFRFFLVNLGERDLPIRSTLLIYLAGLSMVVTPGKVGEWVKSYLLREIHGIALERTIPIVLAERISDAIALALIALFGLLFVQGSWIPALAAVVLLLTALIFFRFPPVRDLLLGIARNTPVVSRLVPALDRFFISGATLLTIKTFSSAIMLSLVAWSNECVGYGLILAAAGVPLSIATFGQAGFIFASSLLAGAVLLIPGGLGVAEGGMTGLSQLVFGLTPSEAAATTILTRLSTIWFGVGLGIAALLVISRRSPTVLSAPTERVTPSTNGASGR